MKQLKIDVLIWQSTDAFCSGIDSIEIYVTILLIKKMSMEIDEISDVH